MKRYISIVFVLIFLIFIYSVASQDDSVTAQEDPVSEETNLEINDDSIDISKLSYQELEVLAYEDDAEAQYAIAQMLEYGTDTVSQDLAQALDWYQKAAINDYADAYAAVGYFYLTGTVVDQDIDTATAYFNQAILLGSLDAKVGLGRAKLATLPAEAFQVTEGDSESTEDSIEANSDEENVGEESVDNTEESNETNLDDTDLDAIDTDDTSDYTALEKEIFDLFKAAQMAGSLDGAFYLGYAYEFGIGTDIDLSKALTYYSEAATSQSTELKDQYGINIANVTLGLMYMNGNGVEADSAKALEYFTIASDRGFPNAMYYIGQMYENGMEVDQDYEVAMDYYMQAADLDYAPALNQIGYLYFNGYGVDVDFSSAVYYQKLAALQGYAPAQVNLGFLYENGYGVERNLETALSYYELASKSGYEGAAEAATRVRAQLNEES